MGFKERFDIFIEPHIGFGIRWDSWLYPVHLSVAIMCVTITIGLGRCRIKEIKEKICDIQKIEKNAIQLFNEQALLISKSDSTVSLDCENTDDANTIFDWLENINGYT